MNIHSPQELGSYASRNAVFASLRAKLTGEVSSSAVLADLLDKLNRMQEAQGRPGEFKASFEAFIARADEHLEVLRPFFRSWCNFCLLTRNCTRRPRLRESKQPMNWIGPWKWLSFPIYKPPSCIGRQVSK